MKLNTIQKREKLNDVYLVDSKGPGGANHRYVICKHGETDWSCGNNSIGVYADIQLQKGARKEIDSIQGVIDADLLEIVRHRLQCFQDGPFANDYNAHALRHIEEALHCMNARIEDRIERNVLGTYNK